MNQFEQDQSPLEYRMKTTGPEMKCPSLLRGWVCQTFAEAADYSIRGSRRNKKIDPNRRRTHGHVLDTPLTGRLASCFPTKTPFAHQGRDNS